MKTNWFKITIPPIGSLFQNVIFNGNSATFAELLIYLKQGATCKDCDLNYWNCMCNYCEKCMYTFCICNFELEDNNFSSKNRIIIRNEAFILLKLILSKSWSKKIINRISESYDFEYLKNNFNKKEFMLVQEITKEFL